jgi:hypothetical protein
MRRSRWLLAALPAALLLLGASACASDLLPPQVPTGGYVFEVEYANYAWTPTWYGISVDENGDVWAWDASDRAHPGTEPDLPHTADLAAKYAHHRRLVRHLDPAQVAARTALIGAAQAGPLLPPVGRCADAGGYRFRAFRYDAGTDTYTPVLLHQNGDLARENASAAAHELTEWLRGLDARFAGRSCEP